MYGLIYKSDVKDLLYSKSEEVSDGEETLLNELMADVEDMSEVPARGVETSHWNIVGKTMFCDKCGNGFRTNNGYDYCPSCGRYMHDL